MGCFSPHLLDGNKKPTEEAIEKYEDGFISTTDKYVNTEYQDISKMRSEHEVTKMLEKHGLEKLPSIDDHAHDDDYIPEYSYRTPIITMKDEM